MAWVVEDVLRRAYRRFGTYLAGEWRQFGRLIGVTFEFVDMPSWLPALRVGTTIFIRRGMSAIENAWWAWHELAHVLMHPGNFLAPTGDQVPSKQERQADEFAALFPIWEVPDVTFCATPVRVASWDWESERRYLGCLWGGGA